MCVWMFDLFNKTSTFGHWIPSHFVIIDGAEMNIWYRRKTAQIFCSSSSQEVDSFSPSLNLGVIIWLAFLSGDLSKFDASRGLKSVYVLGLACFWLLGILIPPYEEAGASLLVKERPHRDWAQSSQLRPKYVNEVIQLGHSAPGELTQTWRTMQSTYWTWQVINVCYFNPLSLGSLLFIQS